MIYLSLVFNYCVYKGHSTPWLYHWEWADPGPPRSLNITGPLAWRGSCKGSQFQTWHNQGLGQRAKPFKGKLVIDILQICSNYAIESNVIKVVSLTLIECIFEVFRSIQSYTHTY